MLTPLYRQDKYHMVTLSSDPHVEGCNYKVQGWGFLPKCGNNFSERLSYHSKGVKLALLSP